MRVAVIQQKNQSDLQANLEHSLSLIREAADQGAELVLLGFCFLDADDVGVLPRQPVEKTLAGRRTDAVGVETDDSQGGGTRSIYRKG